VATLCRWRRAYGAMETNAARKLKELRERNARLAVVGQSGARERRAASGGQEEILSPAAQRRAVDMLTTTLRMPQRLACKAVVLATTNRPKRAAGADACCPGRGFAA
jgi:hypothetical protein